MLVSSNNWHYSWPEIPERRQILQVWWPQRVKEQTAKDHIQHPSNRLHFKALEAYPGELLGDQPELGVKPPTSMKVFTHKSKHRVLGNWSGTQEWCSRDSGFLKHYQMKTNMEGPLTPWCFSIAHLFIYLGAGKDSPLLIGKYFCFFLCNWLLFGLVSLLVTYLQNFLSSFS